MRSGTFGIKNNFPQLNISDSNEDEEKLMFFTSLNSPSDYLVLHIQLWTSHKSPLHSFNCSVRSHLIQLASHFLYTLPAGGVAACMWRRRNSFPPHTMYPQLYVPTALQQRLLKLSDYSNPVGHLVVRILYQSLHSPFQWLSMAIYCHAISALCTRSAWDRSL